MAAMASCPERQLLDAKGGNQSFAHEMNHWQLSAMMSERLDGLKWVVSGIAAYDDLMLKVTVKPSHGAL